MANRRLHVEDEIVLRGGPLKDRVILRGQCADCGGIAGDGHGCTYAFPESAPLGYYRLEPGASTARYVFDNGLLNRQHAAS